MLIVKPSWNNVLLKLNPVSGREVNGIVLPDKHAEKIRVADVLAVGPEVTHYKAGDKVIVSYFEGTVIALFENKWGDDTIRVLPDRAIMAKVEEHGD